MCGVFGYVTDRDEALGPILVEAAQRLTYRGYDSVGAATFRDGAIDLRKDVGKVDAVAARHDFAAMRGQPRDRPAPLGDVRRAVAGQRPAAPRLGRLDGRRPQRQRRQQRGAARPVPRRGDDGPLGQRRRELRPCRGALRPAGPRARRGDPARLWGPGRGLRVRDRAGGRRPAVCVQEGIRPRRRHRRRLHLCLVGPAVDPAADADGDPAARRGDRDAVGRSGRGSLGRRRQPRRPPGRGRHRDDGRGPEGRLRALHAQGDPRAAGGRPRAPAPAGRERGRGAPGRADAERPAALPDRLRHELPRRRRPAPSTSPRSPGARRSPSWRRSSSPSTRPRWVPRTSGSSSASRARPRTSSTPSKRRSVGGWPASDWPTSSAPP